MDSNAENTRASWLAGWQAGKHLTNWRKSSYMYMDHLEKKIIVNN